MTLSSYLKSLKIKDLKSRTTCFLIKENQILLGQKTEGIGKGNYIGIGGKQEKDESLEDTVKRELKEEINVSAIHFSQMAKLDFYFQTKPGWNQRVYVHLCDKWKSEPKESEEIKPVWVDIDKIPYNKMWEDALFYLPFILKGKKVEAEFLYNDNNIVIDCNSRIYT